MLTSESNIPCLVTVSLLAIIAAFVLLAAVVTAVHRIHEGCVGLYFKNGALLDDHTGPGIHWAQPFVTTVEEMEVRPETKMMDPMVCTTRDGVKNVFRDIQIISSIKEDHVRLAYAG